MVEIVYNIFFLFIKITLKVRYQIDIVYFTKRMYIFYGFVKFFNKDEYSIIRTSSSQEDFLCTQYL